MRLFIALDVNKQARAALYVVQQTMQKLGIAGTYVPPGNFHVTLRFLGETDRLGEIGLAMGEFVRGIRPFPLRLMEYKTFGGRTAVVQCGGDGGELKRLFESAQAALFDAGFAKETRPLVPHITLARRTSPHAEHIDALNAALTSAEFFVDHVTLYESVRNKRGVMEYRPLQKNAF
ncbi:MAG: RNA 2',3'-cyclic phosphodiesterase [Christensenellales bacterium]